LDDNFEQNVFINCPLDKDYEPILQAILFCIVFLGYEPRLALESNNSADNRLQKIIELIQCSKFSIHDLSRCVAAKRGELFRLNMPFELGVDYACKKFLNSPYSDKKFLILEEEKYQSKATISDLSGCDFEEHNGDFQKAMRKVRNWLVSEENLTNIVGTQRIIDAYDDF
jgi:hypothetical protein